MKIERTFKDKVLDLIYNTAFCEEGKWRDGKGNRHFHRMEMCGELIEKIEEMEENDGNRTENR